MKFVLNIYEKKKVVKTYETDAYDLMFGTLEDFLNIIDEKMFADDVSNIDFAKLGLTVIKRCLKELKPLLLDVFEGLTEDELRNTKASELIGVIYAIAKYSFAEINGVNGSGKNA